MFLRKQQAAVYHAVYCFVGSRQKRACRGQVAHRPIMSSTPYQNLDHKPTSAWVTAAKYLGLAAVAFAVGAFVDHTMFGDARTSQLPPDYVPKCSGTETLGVTLEEACSRIEEAAGAAGARRKLTGTSTSYSCLPHYRVPLTGTDGRVVFPYHAEMDLTKGDPKITMAIVVIHGAMRDADNYFCAFYDLHKDQKRAPQVDEAPPRCPGALGSGRGQARACAAQARRPIADPSIHCRVGERCCPRRRTAHARRP